MEIKKEDLIKYRNDNNLTQSQLGELIGVKIRTMQYYEKGEKEMSESAKIAFIRLINSAENAQNFIEHNDLKPNNVVGKLSQKEEKELALMFLENQEQMLNSPYIKPIIEKVISDTKNELLLEMININPERLEWYKKIKK